MLGLDLEFPDGDDYYERVDLLIKAGMRFVEKPRRTAFLRWTLFRESTRLVTGSTLVILPLFLTLRISSSR